MPCLLVLVNLLLAQTSPAIRVDRARITYGNTLQVTITNPTATAITYYINLEVLVAGYWGPADEDILYPPIVKRSATYLLKPGQTRKIYYHTKVLSRNYAHDFHTYRMSLHWLSNPHATRERVASSAEFAIRLPKADRQNQP
jgi:hypothetical protein